jgi:hypothetical protein
VTWFVVDDKLHEHQKAHRAGPEALGLWVLAGSYCGDNLNDGFVPERALVRWVPSQSKGRRLAARLVDAGLWEPGTRDGERGWWFHDWPEYQMTRAQVEERRKQKAEAGRQGGLKSGRSRREASAKAEASQLVEPPIPIPHPLSVVTSLGQSCPQRPRLDDDGLDRIAQATNGTRAFAKRVSDLILAKASGEVRNPVRYVLAVVEAEPEMHRYRRGNPTRESECPDHGGEWADACRMHALETRLGVSSP